MDAIKIQCAKSCLISLWKHKCVSVRWQRSNVLISGLAGASCCRERSPCTAWPQARKSPRQISLSAASGNTSAHFLFSWPGARLNCEHTHHRTRSSNINQKCVFSLEAPAIYLTLSHKQTRTVPPPQHSPSNDLTTTHPACFPSTTFKTVIFIINCTIRTDWKFARFPSSKLLKESKQ